LQRENKLISIGKITKPVGLKGYVKVFSLTDFPERYKKLVQVKIYSEKEKTVIQNRFSNSEDFLIKDVIFDKEFLRVLFENYEDIKLTDILIGCFIVIEESERMKLDKGQYYLYDIIGLDVITNDKKIGTLVSIENYGGQDLLKIKLTEDNKEVLIPFVDDFIKNVDVVKKIIEIEVIDGMLN
jgi:16S rRNA processing protein RimM